MNTGIHDFKELNQKFMNKSEKEIINDYPDISEEYRQRIRIKPRTEKFIIWAVELVFVVAIVICVLYWCTK